MPTLINKPTRITSAGNKVKLIDEYIGRVNSGHSGISVAHMQSPGGWVEPGQTPEFEEYTLVLKGTLRVEHKDGSLDVSAVGGEDTRQVGRQAVAGGFLVGSVGGGRLLLGKVPQQVDHCLSVAGREVKQLGHPSSRRQGQSQV